MKADPTRIQIRDISESTYDSLARALRQNLKKYKIKGGFKVVYSNE
jgi:tRNA A37 threonylcarbamoyladenosine dehydratase